MGPTANLKPKIDRKFVESQAKECYLNKKKVLS